MVLPAPIFSDKQVYSMLTEPVARWFRGKYGRFTEPQRGAIPLIRQGKNVLVSSPTGTGKTLAAFLGIIDELYRLHYEGALTDNIYVVYVSPLRALNNDMRRNLLAPLREIAETAKSLGLEAPGIRVMVRTSDTPQHEKQKMLKSPPHILITTPESLAIALVAPKFREKLSTARWVIVDEIHELASSKRGAFLSLSLERLNYAVEEMGGRLQRIGMSATISPLETVARFLAGYNDDGTPREVYVVDARFAKKTDIKVLAPKVDLMREDPERVNEAIYDLLVSLIKRHRTTLVFTNTRSATERVVYKLKKRIEKMGLWSPEAIEAHHSSLSRDLRLDIEEKLKKGELRVVVSSTSLELGIDIGYIDLVVLLSSPKSVSRLLQRIGRAGHHIRRTSKGRIIVVDRDDLLECTVLAKSAMERFIDRVEIPRKPLDVLAQHIVGMAVERKWRVDEAYRLVRRSFNYRDLTFDEFMSVIEYLSGRYGMEEERVYAKIWYDEVEGVFGRKRGARMIYQLNSGVIPDEAKIAVITRTGKYVGNLEEEFVEILSPGDIFVLAGRTFRFLRADGLRVIVEEAEGLRPTVPSWFSEMLPLSFDSALKVGEFRRRISGLLAEKGIGYVVSHLVNEYRVEEHAAREIAKYLWEQMLYVGKVPSDRLILVEFFEDNGSWSIVFHTLFGRRVNDALSRAFANVLSRKTGYPVRVTISDNGFLLSTPHRPDKGLIEGLFSEVTKDNIRDLLEEVVSRTELMRRRFRHVAQRSFMILRRYRGKEKDPERLQLSAQRLLEILLETHRDHPVVRETLREILEDYMDIRNAAKVLEWIEKGRVAVEIVGPLEHPSPFAHHLVARSYSDVVLMEDRRKLLQRLHERVLELLKRRGATISWQA